MQNARAVESLRHQAALKQSPRVLAIARLEVKQYKLVCLFTRLQLDKAAVGALGSGLTCDPGA